MRLNRNAGVMPEHLFKQGFVSFGSKFFYTATLLLCKTMRLNAKV